MKVVIRNVKTGLYFKSDDEWTTDTETAMDFFRGADAISFAMRNSLADVEVIHSFPEPEYNISSGVLAIGPKKPRSPIPTDNLRHKTHESGAHFKGGYLP